MEKSLCRECGEEPKYARNAYCVDCYNKDRRKRYSESLEKRNQVRSSGLKNRYGISLEEFNKILEDQGGKCVICQSGSPMGKGWHVDHDHACCPGVRSCGKCIRSILCGKCNAGLGMFNEDIVLLKKAIEYLK